MDMPAIFDHYAATPEVDVLPSYFPIPGLGILPVNAFVLKSAEPVLVDTGLRALSDGFMDQLSAVIDPGDLAWLWLTHTDQDHIGSLHRIIEAVPDLKIITTFLGLGKMSLFHPLPMDRVYLLNPGQSIHVGDRKLTAIRPPTYDAPETTGFYDHKSSILFSSDCFGALMSKPAASAAEIGSRALRNGLVRWAKADSPWIHMIDREQFLKTINYVRVLSPKIILSSHLPVAHGITDELLRYVSDVPEEEPFVGPDQQALEEMLKGRERNPG